LRNSAGLGLLMAITVTAHRSTTAMWRILNIFASFEKAAATDLLHFTARIGIFG
jgi:hypothetical protein